MTPTGRLLNVLVATKVMQINIDEWSEIPPYSTDIAAAWKVVERITRVPETENEARTAVNTVFGFWFDKAHLWSHSSQEAATAICLAALRAVGAL